MAIKEQDKVFYEEAENGDKIINLPITRANNVEGLGRSANTYYSVGNMVYADSNLSVALKCTQSGTTSNEELDVSNKVVGESVEDGSVTWEVVSRDTVATIDKERPIKTFTSLEQLGLDKTTVDWISIFNAMPEGSQLVFRARNNEGYPVLSLPFDDVWFAVKCIKYTDDSYMEVKAVMWGLQAEWLGLADNVEFKGWKKIANIGALSMPSTNKISLSYQTGSDGLMHYSAPADGYITFRVNGNANERYIYTPDSQLISVEQPLVSTIYVGWHPIAKGEYALISLGTYSSLQYLEFVYAQSEV